MIKRSLLPRSAIVAVLCLLVAFGAVRTASAQTEDVQETTAEPNPFGDVLRVSLLTIGQGDEMWDSFGHNGLLIENVQTGQSVAYDWGRFSFAQEGFFKNLLMGRMQYSMGASAPQALFEHYEGLNRSVTVQRLNLEPAAKIALIQAIEANRASPEYRYEYFLDNCSTRVRDLIDQATGGALGRTAAVPEEEYRFHTRRLTQHSVPLWAGFDVLLGNGGDERISRWAGLFTPLELVEEVREVEVQVGGRTVPLVASEEVLYASTRPAEDEEPRSMLALFLGLGLGFGGLVAFLGSRSGKGDRLARFGFATFTTVWSLVAGVVGVALVFVLFTDHIWMHWNENLLQFSPLSLLIVPAAILAAWRKKAGRGTLQLAGAAALLSFLGFVLQVFPGFDQGNGELIALALPIHVGVLWALREIAPPPHPHT